MGPILHNITLFAEPIGNFHGLTITNSLLTSWAAVLIIIIVSMVLRFGLKTIPNKLQNILIAL